MEREYFRRGQRKTVEEIDDVVTIRVTPNERGEAGAGVRSFGTAAGVAEVGMPEDAFYVFQKARWLFVKPSSETNRSLNASEAIPNAEDAGKLMRRSNGRFATVTRRLNV